MPPLRHSCCPKPVHISSLGTGTRLSYAQTSQTADLETNIQSGLLLRSWNKWLMHWNAILFQLVYGSTTYRPVCLFPHIKLRWNYNPMEFANEAHQFQHESRENRDFTVLPVITYIYLCRRINASCLSYISNRPRIGQKLNWNVTQALQKPYTIGILSYGQLVLSPL